MLKKIFLITAISISASLAVSASTFSSDIDSRVNSSATKEIPSEAETVALDLSAGNQEAITALRVSMEDYVKIRASSSEDKRTSQDVMSEILEKWREFAVTHIPVLVRESSVENEILEELIKRKKIDWISGNQKKLESVRLTRKPFVLPIISPFSPLEVKEAKIMKEAKNKIKNALNLLKSGQKLSYQNVQQWRRHYNAIVEDDKEYMESRKEILSILDLRETEYKAELKAKEGEYRAKEAEHQVEDIKNTEEKLREWGAIYLIKNSQEEQDLDKLVGKVSKEQRNALQEAIKFERLNKHRFASAANPFERSRF